MRYKIAVGGIHIESSTFTPYISGKADFRVVRGQELLALYPWREKYSHQVELIPLIHARALPGGVVSHDFYQEWFDEFTGLLRRQLKNQSIDGLFLDIHGAMSVEGMIDAEGTLAKELRQIIGHNILISCAMDLHGNVTDDLFNACDLLTCYRTAPHIDTRQTRERALANLLRLLKTGRNKLVRAKVDIPILLPGEKTSTEVEPGKSLYAEINKMTNHPDIWDAAIWMGFPWADQPRCHGCVVLCGTDKQLIQTEAAALAEKFWSYRHDFVFVGPTAPMKEAIKLALDSEQKPFFISDTGDNPGAGGAGDMNLMLKEFIKLNQQHKISKKVLFASIYDETSIEQIYQKQIGDKLTLDLGGKIDLSFGGPARLTVAVDYLFTHPVAGRAARVHFDNISVIITENRFQYGKWEYFKGSGLDSFDDYDIIIVKMGYLEPDLSQAAKGWVMALTAGAVNQDLLHIPFRHLKTPLYPFDHDFTPNLTVKFANPL